MPARLACYGWQASDGKKSHSIFVKENENVTGQVYQDLLKRHFLPWLRANYAPGTYVYQQDGARCHTSASTVAFLKREKEEFWSKEMWPPSSPNLNPLDYSIWARLVTKVNSKRHTSVTNLKKVIKKEWEAMEKDYIKKVTSRFRSRLERVLENDGAYVS